jgi:hypothetical protein
MHRKIDQRLRETRNDKIWLNSDDVALAFKPLKMGLRLALFRDDWEAFHGAYDRILTTCDKIFKIEVS